MLYSVRTYLALSSLAIVLCILFSVPVWSQPFLPLQPGMGVASCATVPNFIGNRPPGEFVVGIMDLRNPPAARIGLNWGPPMYHGPGDSWTDDNLGQIFGICLDDSGNIYAATTTCYGTAANGARLIGPDGPGAIYRLDGKTGMISSFVQLPNTGPGLGNICFDRRNRQIFATNHEDGIIYRISLNGDILETFDPYNPDDGSDGFAPLGERLWGIGVYRNRVYYSVWWENNAEVVSRGKNEIRSTGLTPSGEFTDDDRLEFQLPDLNNEDYSEPVSDIAFAADGRMLVAERSMDGNTEPGFHAARAMGYREVAGSWAFDRQYYVGNFTVRNNHNNSAGGIDFTYSGFSASENRPTGCDEALWVSGDALHFPGHNPDRGDDFVYGIARIPTSGNTPDNASSTSYYVDLDGNLSSVDKTLIGDVEIFRRSCLMPTSSTDSLCLADSTRLSAPDGEDYRWSPGTGLSCTQCQFPMASPDSTTEYTVEVASATGDWVPHRRIVYVRDCTSSTFDSISICRFDSVQLSVPTGVFYRWSPATGLSCTDCPAPTASPLESTLYTCLVISTSGDTVVHSRKVLVQPTVAWYTDIEIRPSEKHHDLATVLVRLDSLTPGLETGDFIATITYSDSTLLLEEPSLLTPEQLLAGNTAAGWSSKILDAGPDFLRARFTANSSAANLRDTGILFRMLFRQVIASYSQNSVVKIRIELPGKECVRIDETTDTIPKTICGLEHRLIEWAFEKYAVQIEQAPANREVTVRLSLPFESRVSAGIYDTRGAYLGSLVRDRLFAPGVHFISWDAHDVPSGIYYLQCISGDRILTKEIHIAR